MNTGTISAIKLDIKRIKKIHFNVNEDLYVNDPSKSIKIELNQNFGVNTDAYFIKFILKCYFHYEGSSEILAEIQVENIFEVPDLKSFVDSAFPRDLMILIVGLSISHTRALLADNLAGTVYEQVILPLSNPFDVTKHFFPFLFETDQQNQEMVTN